MFIPLLPIFVKASGKTFLKIREDAISTISTRDDFSEIAEPKLFQRLTNHASKSRAWFFRETRFEEPVFLYKIFNTDKGFVRHFEKSWKTPAPSALARRRLSHLSLEARQKRGAESTQSNRPNWSDTRPRPGDGREIHRTGTYRARLRPIARIDRNLARPLSPATRFCRPRCFPGEPGRTMGGAIVVKSRRARPTYQQRRHHQSKRSTLASARRRVRPPLRHQREGGRQRHSPFRARDDRTQGWAHHQFQLDLGPDGFLGSRAVLRQQMGDRRLNA